jgi:hypothetical protein
VTVLRPSVFCMMMWLPRRRTSTNPLLANIRQTSRPDRILSLANRDLNLRHVHLAVQPLLNLCRGSGLEE